MSYIRAISLFICSPSSLASSSFLYPSSFSLTLQHRTHIILTSTTYIYALSPSIWPNISVTFSSFVVNSLSLNCKSCVFAVSVFWSDVIFELASSFDSEISFAFFYWCAVSILAFSNYVCNWLFFCYNYCIVFACSWFCYAFSFFSFS